MLILTTLFACFSSCGAKGQDSAQDTAGEDTAEEVVEENDTAGE